MGCSGQTSEGVLATMVYTHNMFWAVQFRDAVWDTNTAGLHQHDAGLELASPDSEPAQAVPAQCCFTMIAVLCPAAMPHAMPHSSTLAGAFQG